MLCNVITVVKSPLYIHYEFHYGVMQVQCIPLPPLYMVCSILGHTLKCKQPHLYAVLEVEIVHEMLTNCDVRGQRALKWLDAK